MNTGGEPGLREGGKVAAVLIVHRDAAGFGSAARGRTGFRAHVQAEQRELFLVAQRGLTGADVRLTHRCGVIAVNRAEIGRKLLADACAGGLEALKPRLFRRVVERADALGVFAGGFGGGGRGRDVIRAVAARPGRNRAVVRDLAGQALGVDLVLPFGEQPVALSLARRVRNRLGIVEIVLLPCKKIHRQGAYLP